MSLALILLIKDTITKLVTHFKRKRKMSNRMEREAEDIYEDENDISPVSGGFSDNSYAHETKSGMRDTIPVKRDDDVEESEMHPPYSNSDEQLGKRKLAG